jgi:hypothetical protein
MFWKIKRCKFSQTHRQRKGSCAVCFPSSQPKGASGFSAKPSVRVLIVLRGLLQDLVKVLKHHKA